MTCILHFAKVGALAGVIIRPFTHMYMEGTSAAADGGDVLELKTDTHV
jgi:hypothetical protein